MVLGDAPEVWAEFDAIERVIASAKLLMARRVEDARSWPKQGFRSAVEQMAVLSGTSMSVGAIDVADLEADRRPAQHRAR